MIAQSGTDTGYSPGRFLAAYELKLIIAYIAMHYDIQPFDSRPENARFSDFSVGSMHTLKIRRRRRDHDRKNK